jgi:hypothetical protein
LQDQLQEKNADIRITPVLIALDDDGTRPADAATDSPDDKSVRIVHAPSEQKLAAMASSSDKAELKSTAERLFGLFGAAARGAT